MDAEVRPAHGDKGLDPGERGAVLVTASESVALEEGFAMLLMADGRVIAAGHASR